MSQSFDSLLSKIENYYSDADYTVQDAEHLSRIAISEYANTQNSLVASARQLSTTSVQKIIDLTIDKHITSDPSEWMLFAANAVDNVINYSHRGVLASGLSDFTDLLPLGHPSRTNREAITASALNHATALWAAGDPRIASDQARHDTYKAYASKPGSVEADYASFKLAALVAAGYVPDDISLPITAAFKMSFAERSARAKALAAVRRRDRKQRFADEFGRLKGFFSRGDGSIFTGDGRIVGAQAGTNNFEVEFTGNEEIPDGIYPIDASKTESVKARLSKRALKGIKGVDSIAVPTKGERDAAIPLDQFLATKKDAPEGWTKDEDGSFTSKSGQTLRQVDARPEGDYMFEGIGEGGAEDSTKPFFELKDRNGKTIGAAQDWAGANKIAMTYDALEEDSDPTPEEADQDAKKLSDRKIPNIERTADGYEGETEKASVRVSKEGDKFKVEKGGFEDIDVISGQYEYFEKTLFDTEEEALEDADKWLRLSESPNFFEFMYNDWFESQADGLDQDAKDPNWADEAIDFDDLDNQDNWKDLGGGSREYISPDGKLKLTFEPDGDSGGEGGFVDASGIAIEYDGQFVGSFRATERDLTSPGEVADALSRKLPETNFNPNDLVKADDSGEYEFIPASDVGSVSIVKKYNPATKKLSWVVTKDVGDLIDENLEHSFFEQKSFDSLGDARAYAEEFAQILNDPDKVFAFLDQDFRDNPPGYDGLDQAAKSVSDRDRQLADGYGISPRVELVYNSETKQFDRVVNPDEFEADGDLYDFGSAVVNLSEYSPGKWAATIFYGDRDGSGQDTVELEQFFDSSEEAFKWVANGFGQQFDSSQVAEGIIERNSSVEMLEFINSPEYKDIDKNYRLYRRKPDRTDLEGLDQAAKSVSDRDRQLVREALIAKLRLSPVKIMPAQLMRRDLEGLDQNAPEPLSAGWKTMDEDEKADIIESVSDYIGEWAESNPAEFYTNWARFALDSYYNPDGVRAFEKPYIYAENYMDYLADNDPEMIDVISEKLASPGLDQNAPTKPLSDKQLEPASDAQYNFLQSLVESKMDVDADTIKAVEEAAGNKNLSKAQAGALIGKLRALGDKENLGPYGKPSQKMIDSVNRDVYAKGLSDEDRDAILQDLNSLSKGEVSSIISQLKEMPNVLGGLDNYISSLVEAGDIEALKRLRSDPRNENSFTNLDQSIAGLESGDTSGLDQAASSNEQSGPLYDKEEVSDLLDEIEAAEESNEIGNTFLPKGLLNDFDPESVGDAAALYDELNDAIPNVGSSGTLGAKLTEIAKNLLESIKSRLGTIEFAKRDRDDLGSSSKFDKAVDDLNNFVDYYYPLKASSDMENDPDGGSVGDVRGGGWEASVRFNEETGKWEANITSPGQVSESYGQEFDDQGDAADYASAELYKNNREALDTATNVLSDGGMDSLISEYGDNPAELANVLEGIIEWLQGTKRGQAEEVARALSEVVDRLRETSTPNPKA